LIQDEKLLDGTKEKRAAQIFRKDQEKRNPE
jgi:hypothetical protein